MYFNNTISRSIGLVNSALSTLSSYNDYQAPSSEPNRWIRNTARTTVDPAYYDLQNAARDARWEGISYGNVSEALRGAEYIREATFDLSDRPSQGRPANVWAARQHLQQAMDMLRRAQW